MENGAAPADPVSAASSVPREFDKAGEAAVDGGEPGVLERGEGGPDGGQQAAVGAAAEAAAAAPVVTEGGGEAAAATGEIVASDAQAAGGPEGG